MSKQGICTLAVVPMRSAPRHAAEMVSQLLRGDSFDLLEIGEEWTLARCHYDGYQGWVSNKQYVVLPDQSAGEPTAYINSLLRVPLEPEVERFFYLPSGCSSPSDVAIRYFLGTPYLWGGRSRAGIDCSGLTQLCFKCCGIKLFRDASQQAAQGSPVSGEDDPKCDDLCFFGQSSMRITHVGIALGDGRIIHASGEVRIDRLDRNGIYNDASQCYTHSLQMVRRMLP